jgi:hypothetical protein
VSDLVAGTNNIKGNDMETSDVDALAHDVDEPVLVVDDGAAIDPDVEGSTIVMDAVDLMAAAGLELD